MSQNSTISKMETTQTAVDWLIKNLPEDYILALPYELVEQAKEMEKQQIMDAHISAGARLEDISIEAAEQYYAKVYGKQQNA